MSAGTAYHVCHLAPFTGMEKNRGAHFALQQASKQSSKQASSVCCPIAGTWDVQQAPVGRYTAVQGSAPSAPFTCSDTQAVLLSGSTRLSASAMGASIAS
jgi:hypothetical protein